MKSERRHELKQNTLARGLETLPDVSRRHGTKVLVGIAVALLIALLVRNRIANSRDQAEQAAYSLNAGRDLIQRLEEASERVPATQLVTIAQEISRGVDQSVTQVLDATDDPRMIAEARLVQGDLNWHLANLPDFPGAATRPALALPKPDEQYLNAAADAYRAVLNGPTPPVESTTSARLGLAAVHENRREWDKAKEQYQKVVDDTAAPKPLKDLAAQALTRLETLRRTPLMAPPTTQQLDFLGRPIPPTSAPATAPATTPATQDAKPQATPSPAPAAPAQPAPAQPAPATPEQPAPQQPAPQPAPQNPTNPG
jgi:hypothetical protein